MYEYQARITRTIDGDTYEADIDLGFYVTLHRQRIRLYGLDTPEVFGKNATPEGHEATTFAETWFRARAHRVVLRTHKALTKRGDEKQSLDRWLAEVYDDHGESLADALREAGYEK